MWPEEFIRGANEEVAAKILHVGRYMRHRLHCINVGPCADFVCFCADRFYVINRACHITGATHTNQFRLVRQDVIELFKIKLERLGIEWQPSNLQVEVACQEEPGRDVRIVIHVREDDFVTGLKTTSNRSRNMQSQRRHVLPEYDLVARRCIEEIGYRCMRFFD